MVSLDVDAASGLALRTYHCAGERTTNLTRCCGFASVHIAAGAARSLGSCYGSESLLTAVPRLRPNAHTAAMARKDIMFPLKDAALRDDVHTLGNLVGEVHADQGGRRFLDEVEGDRQAAIGRRNGDPDAAVELVVRSQARTPRDAQAS